LPVLDNPAPAADYVEQVGGVSFDMVYIPGGTFTLGCETSSCDPDTSPVPGVSVSSYHMMKNEVSAALREAVTGEAVSGFGSGNWYDCIRLACELSRQTGRPYRMQTEAEFEYAAKNYLGKLAQIDGSEEWEYNSWSTSHSTDLTDPVGPASGKHTQKTRRDKATGDNITGRLIRSIDGIGPSCRLVVSNEMDYPPDYVPPCQICPPHGEEPENSYRDPRWITGSDMHWVAGAELGFGTMDLRVWEDGTAKQGNTDGQWFTSNNIAFVFVPNSGTRTTYSTSSSTTHRVAALRRGLRVRGRGLHRQDREGARGQRRQADHPQPAERRGPRRRGRTQLQDDRHGQHPGVGQGAGSAAARRGGPGMVPEQHQRRWHAQLPVGRGPRRVPVRRHRWR
jgi:hypothetical protein